MKRSLYHAPPSQEAHTYAHAHTRPTSALPAPGALSCGARLPASCAHVIAVCACHWGVRMSLRALASHYAHVKYTSLFTLHHNNFTLSTWHCAPLASHYTHVRYTSLFKQITIILRYLPGIARSWLHIDLHHNLCIVLQRPPPPSSSTLSTPVVMKFAIGSWFELLT